MSDPRRRYRVPIGWENTYTFIFVGHWDELDIEMFTTGKGENIFFVGRWSSAHDDYTFIYFRAADQSVINEGEYKEGKLAKLRAAFNYFREHKTLRRGCHA